VPGGRNHVVLIPGFAGFDALGQLEYYARVTPLFAGRVNATLHYFDSFPTAAVATRSDRLLAWLAKRMARGEIAHGDDITLVGHSTGGLDIRALVWKLHLRQGPIVVDGGAEIDPGDLLAAIRRVVFLSVPHWGTNIADWVRSYPTWRRLVVADLRAAASASGSPLPALDRVAPGLAALAGRYLRVGLFQAIEDSLRESNPAHGHATLNRLADAHEAASQLDLYLRHMMADFRAIDDLTAKPPPGDPESPAHYPPSLRQAEERLWRKLKIKVRSYATVGPRPYQFEPGEPAPTWDLSRPWTGLGILCPGAGRRSDLVYRTCYRACAGGPFSHTASRIPGDLESWDNDGIVNTASMDWPIGDTILLRADHMDVVGHFAPVSASSGSARRHIAYDLLGSGAGFDADDFRALWDDIFTWAIPEAPSFTVAAKPPVGRSATHAGPEHSPRESRR
jgi:hypothetical protein